MVMSSVSWAEDKADEWRTDEKVVVKKGKITAKKPSEALALGPYAVQPVAPRSDCGYVRMPAYGLRDGDVALSDPAAVLGAEDYKLLEEEFPELATICVGTLKGLKSHAEIVIANDICSLRDSEFKVGKVKDICKQAKELMKLKEEDPQAFDLEKRILIGDCKAEAFAKTVRAEKDSAVKEENVTKLRTMLNDLFKLRQQRRQVEADAIAAELKKIQNFLTKREEHKDEIIQRRLDQLTGDTTLEW